jgi:hypothetical protein
VTTALARDLEGLIRTEPAVYASRTCRETMRVMFQHPESKSIVVCNAANEPLGALMSERFFLRATDQIGMDFFYSDPVTKLMNRSPLVLDITAPLEAALTAAHSRPDDAKNDCVIVTRGGKYAGVAYPSDLLRCLQ